MKNCVLLLCLLLSMEIFAQQPKESQSHRTDSLKKEMAKVKAANKKQATKTQLRYFVIKAANNTYGYDVYADGKLYLHQPTIPAISGNNGFADTTSAAKTARLAIQKIKKGEMPPTITVDELKKLGVVQ